MLTEKYGFQETEYKYNILWEGSKTYKWCGKKDNNFIIDTPPPTISGKLHIEHIFSYCHTDFIARYQRMIGKDVFYPIGFDDNGLPTERLVEQVSKVHAAEVDRSKFIQMCEEVSSKSRQEFKKLFQAIGISYDWNLEYHTIGKNAMKLSQMSFIDLYNKGYIYRKLEPILWDTVDQTAIAQAEVEDKVLPSLMHTISFFKEDNQRINIATTRPELLPACVAVFCHPKDIRYSNLIGKYAITPLFQNKVPILADDKVKIEKGTGLVMCCTFGDETDTYWWRKHGLPTKTIISKSGKISGVVGEIEGLSIKSARKRIVEILAAENFLVRSEEITHSVKYAERSGTELEILPTYQWFIRILEYKNELLAKVKECNWHPKSMQKRIEIWIENLNWDWCISRQRYFGVQLPVWYSQRKGEEGKIILPKIEDLPIDPQKDLPKGYSREEIMAEKDVMDTWATSALTPQLNALAIDEEFKIDNHNILFPADLRPQSHEIIRTWAFYTIVKSHYHANSIPWKNIMISGWCLAHDKKKMNKSKGNVITPDSILNTYGADVVRYWAANSRLGVDTTFSEDIFKTGRRFITKIWNASKFVSNFMQRHQELDVDSITQTLDKWIVSNLYRTIKKVTEKFECFEYCEALCIIERFFWDDFCDNYLEFVKKRAYGEGMEESLSAKQSLAYVLNIMLRLLAPFFPYITEEIYHQLYSYNSIHNQGNWPRIEDSFYDEKAEAIGKSCLEVLDIVRKFKSDNNISIKSPIKKLRIKAKDENYKITQSAEKDLNAVCNAEVVEWGNDVYSELETERFIVNIELAQI